MSTSAFTTKKALILGLPNSGKSQLFTRLTRRYAEVANAPLTTIDLNRAPLAFEEGTFELIDSPGIQDLFLSVDTCEPLRQALFTERPDLLIMCVDANRLKQSLALTLEVLTLGLPMVVSLNLLNDANSRGVFIDAGRLSQALGAPVFVKKGDADDAGRLAAALKTAQPGQLKRLSFSASLGACVRSIEEVLPAGFPYPRTAALHLLMGGAATPEYMGHPLDAATQATLRARVDEAVKDIRGAPQSVVSNAWNTWIDAVAERCVTVRENRESDALRVVARLTRSVVFGPPILLMILFATFLLVVDGANSLSEWMNDGLWAPVRDSLARVLPPGFWSDLLIGDYGVLSMGLANALLTVLPILSVFYLIFNTLEDVGYLPNLSVLTRRILGKLGLGGSAIMPLILGFGCKTMATLTARTLTSPREKYITIFLIAFAIPCAGQMGLNMSIIGRMGWSAFVISSTALVVVELGAGILLNRFLKQSEERDPFILELPPIRVPKLRSVMQKTYFRVASFLRESLAVFVYAALILFVSDKIGLLGVIKAVLGPLVEGALGLPRSMIDAILLLLARHEAAAAVIIDMIRKGQLDYKQSIVAVTLTTMFIPCFANVMAMGKVLGGKDAAVILLSVNVFALAAAGALNWLLTAMSL